MRPGFGGGGHIGFCFSAFFIKKTREFPSALSLLAGDVLIDHDRALKISDAWRM